MLKIRKERWEKLPDWQARISAQLALDPANNRAELARLFLHGRETDPRYRQFEQTEEERRLIPENCRAFTGINTIIRRIQSIAETSPQAPDYDENTSKEAKRLLSIFSQTVGLKGIKDIITKLDYIVTTGLGIIEFNQTRLFNRDIDQLRTEASSQ